MDFYRLGLMVSSLLLDSVFGTGVRAQEVKEQSKKNVLFLIVDDLRTELNCWCQLLRCEVYENSEYRPACRARCDV